MKLHNTLTRSVEEFKPQTQKVSFYSCGPTVYSSPTIGNWTSYIRWDVLARTLRLNYDLDWYMNITDVGHLVSDADDGEDKLEKGARREGKTAWEVAEMYTEDFVAGLKKLNISIDKNNLLKATDYISEQIKLIETLESKGYTYQISDGIYFDSSKFSEYGKMARLDISGLREGIRVEKGDKKNATDFALWKFSPKDKQRDMEWDSPWGKGFPGWHIECSAMAMKFLGNTIDIHSGGIDLIPVHHTNEIAQSQAVTGKKFVKYWVHSNFLQIDGSKIAKSLGNSYTLQDLETKGFTAMDFRMFAIQSHYQTEANFSWEGLAAAQNRLKDLQALADLRFQVSSKSAVNFSVIQKTKEFITKALNDNLNTPQALAAISKLGNTLSQTGISSSQKNEFSEFINWLDLVTGFELSHSADISSDQKTKIQERQTVRQNKQWQESDELRQDLKNQAIGLNDLDSETIWYRL